MWCWRIQTGISSVSSRSDMDRIRTLTHRTQRALVQLSASLGIAASAHITQFVAQEPNNRLEPTRRFLRFSGHREQTVQECHQCQGQDLERRTGMIDKSRFLSQTDRSTRQHILRSGTIRRRCLGSKSVFMSEPGNADLPAQAFIGQITSLRDVGTEYESTSYLILRLAPFPLRSFTGFQKILCNDA